MLWYPYTQMKIMEEPIEILDAKGVWLYTKEGKLIDSISSWWSVIHGYSHPKLNEAILSQVPHFSHIMLGGLTHKPVQEWHCSITSIRAIPNAPWSWHWNTPTTGTPSKPWR